ncbi:hypothetical protein M0805_002211 [Coniferiporia weirii]|nr:hypothetical protein M0805_002211 [Coniferiporia weirii]
MLVHMPTDVVLQILCMSRIEDVLSLERTCSVLRDTTATRHHWLTQLRNLDQAHAPDLAPNVNVDDLSSAQLRNLVTKALSSYRNWKSGSVGGADTRVMTIKPGNPDGRLGHLRPSFNWDTAKLMPGGRFLFLAWTTGYLCVVDLTQNNRVVWSYCNSPDGSDRIDNYAVQMCSNGSMNVLIVTVAGRLRYFDVIQLTPPLDAEGDLKAVKKHCCSAVNFLDGYSDDSCIEGDYAVIALDSSEFMIINWVEHWNLLISYDHYKSVSDVRIRSGHLVYLTSDNTLYAIPLRQLASSRRGSRHDLSVTDVDHCALPLSKLVPCGFKPHSTGAISLCDFSWTTQGSTDLFTGFLRVYNEQDPMDGIHFMAVQIIFDPCESTFAKLKHCRSTKPVMYPFPLSSPGERMASVVGRSRSGRGILRLAFETRRGNGAGAGTRRRREVQADPQVVLSYIGLDKQGDLYYAPVPVLSSLLCESGRPSMETYSGALVCVSKDSSTVNIIYPQSTF